MRARRRVNADRGGAAPYVLTVFGTVAILWVLRVLEAVRTFEASVPVSPVVYLMGMGVTLALWWVFRPVGSAHPLLRVFLGTGLVLWLLTVMRTILGGDAIALVGVSVPILLILMWVKPPIASDGLRIVDGLSWILVALTIVTIAAESLGWLSTWYSFQEGGTPEFIASERNSYWLPLGGVLNIEGRWGGPFLHPNHAGLVGAFLVTVALCRRGYRSWVFLATGLLVLTIAASRTSIVAAGVGAVVVVVASRVWRGRAARSPVTLTALLGIPMLVLGPLLWPTGDAQVSAVDYATAAANLTGRPAAWGPYWDMWLRFPLLGANEQTIRDAVAAGTIPEWAGASAHNMALDALARTGVVGFLLLAAALLAAAGLGIGAARRGWPSAVGVLAVLLTTGMTEALVSWQSLPLATMLLIAAAVAGAVDGTPTDAVPEDQAPSPPPPPAPERGTDPAPNPAPPPAAP